MKIFNEPTIEIEQFEVADVITTSSGNNDWDMGGEDF